MRGVNQDGLSVLRGACVVSPAVVLSAANASTVRRTWSEWSTLTSRGAGRKIDPDRALDDAMNNAPQTWRSMVVNKDNLL